MYEKKRVTNNLITEELNKRIEKHFIFSYKSEISSRIFVKVDILGRNFGLEKGKKKR